MCAIPYLESTQSHRMMASHCCPCVDSGDGKADGGWECVSVCVCVSLLDNRLLGLNIG